MSPCKVVGTAGLERTLLDGDGGRRVGEDLTFLPDLGFEFPNKRNFPLAGLISSYCQVEKASERYSYPQHSCQDNRRNGYSVILGRDRKALCRYSDKSHDVRQVG